MYTHGRRACGAPAPGTSGATGDRRGRCTLAIAPSGEQFEISWEHQRATVVEVGGGVRAYQVDGRRVLDPYPVDAVCDGAHGAPLIPWPNRLADGQYRFDGVEYQVALTEPEKHNAIHGLLRWRSWAAAEQNRRRVVMTTRLHPLPGWPFPLDVSVTYELGEDGLVVTTAATNIGDRACPFACGQHPYLSPGDGLIDDASLELRAATRVLTDAERQLPAGTEPVAGTVFDFATPKRLGDLEVDYAFGELERDDAGRAWMALTGSDGRRVELWVDEAYPFLEVYTGDTLATDRRRRGLGAEPMTCPPNALQTGESLVRLEPGESVQMAWGVRLA